MRQYTKEYIRQLLDKFMDGTTSLKEEDVLSTYFLQDDVPQEWQDYRQLFCELEAMKPTVQRTVSKPEAKPARRRWLRWSAAAAVVGVLFAAILSQPIEQGQEPLLTQTTSEDTTQVPRLEPPNQEALPDTTALYRHLQPATPRKRRLRKQEPTITDHDKSYALLARIEQEHQEAEQQMEQACQELIHARLTAAGYVAILQEDGTIVYTNEPKEYFAYEE